MSGGGAPLVAITREISPEMAACELTHQPRVPIDIVRLLGQHAGYELALEQLGCAVTRLPSGRGMPDAVFVEDTAVVLDELAIVARPGAVSRRGETAAVASALTRHRPVVYIEDPGTLDGGDVLVMGRSILVGHSGRTNRRGIDQLADATAPFGYRVFPIPVHRCLHLKSAVTALDEETLLVDPSSIDVERLHAIGTFRFVDVDPSEPRAANVARVGGELLASTAFPRTGERLAERGFHVTAIDMSEIAKAEGAVTCCSLIFPNR